MKSRMEKTKFESAEQFNAWIEQQKKEHSDDTIDDSPLKYPVVVLWRWEFDDYAVKEFVIYGFVYQDDF